MLRRFRLVFNAVRTHFQQVEKSLGIGGAQAWALSLINEREGIGVTELAREMDVHQSTASNLLKQLLTRGLVETHPHEQDKRAVRLFIAPQGADLLRGWSGPYSGVLPTALGKLDEATLKRMERDLGRLVELLVVDESAAGRPLADL